jgi:hypothetical protein
MSVKTIVAVASTLIAAAAFAQTAGSSLGKIENVQGIVTVTTGSTGGTAATGNPIVSGMRFVATSSGSATLHMNNGCVVRLQPGQAVTVLGSMTCEQLLAGVQSLGVNVAGGSPAVGAAATGALALGSIGLSKALTKQGISSN